MSFKSIIVDDEPLARRGLAVRLAEYHDIELIAQCCNGREAIEAIRAYSPDLMFLDIQMPGLNGFDVIESVIEQGLKMPVVVFVTAFDQYAIKAFEVHALDYILKPADESRLNQTMEKIREYFQNSINSVHKSKLVRLVSDVTGNDYQQILTELDSNQELSISTYSDILAIKDGGEVSRVPVKDILWIDAAGDYMCVHVVNTNKHNNSEESTHILRKTMKELEECLDPKQFIRNHRSTIVNKHYIEKFYSQMNGEYYLVLQNGKELKVSRSYKDKVKQAVNS
ncbi:LytTR family DNA-binding domain-containing protein [Colwellia sp. D2M02]|uniref:LytTR family DNA-binding domain-containing protein n=1 Tax=Colwellia asteriadis TaxID=517723 RepID=A0ABP3WKQ3_9GAMM|nr:LytTR family DNA-binding domain-containing protein [Colwellia sp. D2M02]MBU2892614.1 LytTR family DNA-binding domain-containing protein [Colwellia sp. D2M02]